MIEPRLCRNPDCRRTLDPVRVARHNATTCDAKCRAAAWKAENAYGRGQAPRGGRANGKRKPSGLQLSWCKAVDAVAEALAGGAADAIDRQAAEDILRPALPARQRARLDGRQS